MMKWHRRMLVLKHRYFSNKFLRWFPILLLAISLGFILHEKSRPDGQLKKLKLGIVQSQTNKDVEVDLLGGTFQERFNKLESFCKVHHHNTTMPVRLKKLDIKFANIVVDEAHNVLFSFPEDSLSPALKVFLAYLTGHVPEYEAKRKMLTIEKITATEAEEFAKSIKIPRLHTYSTSDVQTHLSTYNKVLFVRHPIARLHSLYKLYTSFLHSDIKNNTINSIKAKIKAKLQRTSTVDPKKPSTDLCKVCLIKYRWIVKLETLNEDLVPIVKNLYKCIYNKTGTHNIHLNLLNQWSEQLTLRYRQEHKDFQKVISAQATNMTYNRYKEDFKAFGYRKQLGDKGY